MRNHGWQQTVLGTMLVALLGAATFAGATPQSSAAPQKTSSTTKPPQDVTVLNHIIFMAQENRGLDHYFGYMRQYWRQNHYSDISFDGLPQFNPKAGYPPLQGPAPTSPGCDPADPPPADCTVDSASPKVPSYHLITQCVENPSPSWNEGHQDWNLTEPISTTPTLDGYVYTAAHDARNNTPPFHDINGDRVMGYYNGNDLNYYYFMATQFAISDRWFAPVMTRTSSNRDYMIAATSQGYVYPIGTNSRDQKLLTATTIFQELQNAGISWKIYVNPAYSPCQSNPTPACLLTLSYVQNFAWGQTIPTNYPNNIAPISQYFTDLQNGTLPQVAQIEPASDASLDEHGSDSDLYPVDIQAGANYVSSLINALMTSTSWSDSAFILTYDEAGGFYDHVPAHSAVGPDGIAPLDLQPLDICTGNKGPNCYFIYTGFRVPITVISPYSRQHYVDHHPADHTAILKLIETRFNLPALTKRDAAQIDMTSFFDFNNAVWATPPSPPVQNQSGPCYLNHLP